MDDLVRRIGWGLAWSGALLVAAAVISQRGGTRVHFNGGGSANSHASATVVLVSLGLVCWVMALSLVGWLRAEAARGRSRTAGDPASPDDTGSPQQS